MIYAYQKFIDQIRTVYMQFPYEQNRENVQTELATIDNVTYVYVPDDMILPEQPPEINPQIITLTPELKEKIKANSLNCLKISDMMQEKIREKYSQEDEHYLTRISVGVLSGIYRFEPGEQEQVLEFGRFVEDVRSWGRNERAKIGL